MLASLRRYVADPVASWRSGSRESQAFTLVLLLVGVAASFLVSLANYSLMPVTSMFVWLLLGMLFLRFRPLLILVATVAVVGVVAVLADPPVTLVRITALVTTGICMALILFQSSRQRSGLPTTLSEGMLADLRERLQRQGSVPALPEGWHCESAMLAAHGVGYGGDFLVARRGDEERLEMILVDVCGKGVGAATGALQFAGALDGLLGSMPPAQLMSAANDFLLRQQSDESFATAVHVLVDLSTGGFQIISAGHPPALVWLASGRSWGTDLSRGTALGIIGDPGLHGTSGTLAPGDALMFYTDGVIERRDYDIDDSVAWLQRAAAAAVEPGFDGAAQRLISRVRRGDDDRAVLILWRE